MKVIYFYDENSGMPNRNPELRGEYRSEGVNLVEAADHMNPQLFKDIPSMIAWFKQARDYEFPSDQEDRDILAALERGGDFATAVAYFCWAEVHGT